MPPWAQLEGFSCGCKADAAREMFGELLQRFSERKVFEHLPDHDSRALESRLAWQTSGSATIYLPRLTRRGLLFVLIFRKLPSVGGYRKSPLENTSANRNCHATRAWRNFSAGGKRSVFCLPVLSLGARDAKLRAVRKIDWSAVDWLKPVRQIAAEVGCSRQAVYLAQARRWTEPQKTSKRPGRTRTTKRFG